jgi:hypothetical protein
LKGNLLGPIPDARTVTIEPDPALGYDGTYFVGAISTSVPAFGR